MCSFQYFRNQSPSQVQAVVAWAAKEAGWCAGYLCLLWFINASCEGLLQAMGCRAWYNFLNVSAPCVALKWVVQQTEAGLFTFALQARNFFILRQGWLHFTKEASEPK